MKRIASILFDLVILFSLTAGQIFSQQEAVAEQEEGFPIPGWVLGDVIALDLESNQLILSYIDYNTDEEKGTTIGVDASTNYENVKSLKEIKVGDVVAIDYTVGSEGEIIALNISVERLKGTKE